MRWKASAALRGSMNPMLSQWLRSSIIIVQTRGISSAIVTSAGSRSRTIRRARTSFHRDVATSAMVRTAR
jgi:hypothetical protein